MLPGPDLGCCFNMCFGDRSACTGDFSAMLAYCFACGKRHFIAEKWTVVQMVYELSPLQLQYFYFALQWLDLLTDFSWL